ncbi:hypothetical protein A4X09_0g4729 [Tilletia walkeri]|uniref:Polyketide synthase n=1 Tax=Tilletia walkeri TaxID=117179 RepID=A0A8X7N745_9BASI|nr:hypothetical protein A4X09_0g4729 [Tilletia walkeri]
MNRIDIRDEDIAIVGVGCRLPGADTPSKLWDVLADQKDVQSRITRFNAAGYYHPDGTRKGVTPVQHAYFMEGDNVLGEFDSKFFNITPIEAAAMDPQQRILLETVYEAIESAGIALEDFVGTDTAVYTGIFVTDAHTALLRDIDQTPKYQATGTSNSIAANRISYFFDLHGISTTVDTACSSTMVALDAGIKAIRAGAPQALVTGANLIINPDMHCMMSELGFLSPGGRCRSFDAAGDGYVRAEGVGALLIKPLKEALRNNDPIRGVVKAVVINQDGKTPGITLPSAEAQERMIRTAYDVAQLDPGSTFYCEAHSPGTQAGDVRETTALGKVFAKSHSEKPLIVGSIKASIGHLEACAALAGMIKVLLCFEHNAIPPQMHFQKPNPKVNFDALRLKVATEMISWPADRIPRASVNSFGFGGTNGHAIIDAGRPYVEAYRHQMSISRAPATPNSAQKFLFTFSAEQTFSLEETLSRYATWLRERTDLDISDLAYTLSHRRSVFSKNIFITASSADELVHSLNKGLVNVMDRPTPVKGSKIAFVCTGQGAQWPGMGRALIQSHPLFAAAIDRCDRTLQALPDKPNWSVREELCKDKDTSNVYLSSYSQPLCAALQIGLIVLWRSWGIQPSCVVGHSSGELGAAFAAGILSLEDTIVAGYYRGKYMSSSSQLAQSNPGAMLAFGGGEKASRDAIAPFKGRIQIAAINSPTSCTLSGDKDAIEELAAQLKSDGTFHRMLKVDMAYHSHHMVPLAPGYQQALESYGLQPRKARCPMFSSVTGAVLQGAEMDASYLTQNMVSTVSFAPAVLKMLKEAKPDAFIEVGPHPALSSPFNDICTSASLSTDAPYFGSCMRGVNDAEAMLLSAAKLRLAKLPIDMAAVNSRVLNINQTDFGFDCTWSAPEVVLSTPKYAWDHRENFWHESSISKAHRFREFARHDTLGARLNDDTPFRREWRNLMMAKELPWLQKLADEGGHASLPLSYWILALTEAARQLNGGDTTSFELQDLNLKGPLFLEDLLKSETALVETRVSAEQKSDRVWQMQAWSAPVNQPTRDRNSHVWRHHLSVTLELLKQLDIDELNVQHDVKSDGQIREEERLGLVPIEAFQNVVLSTSGANGRIVEQERPYNYPVDPLALTGAFTALLLAASSSVDILGAKPTFDISHVGKIRAAVVGREKAKQDGAILNMSLVSAGKGQKLGQVHLDAGDFTIDCIDVLALAVDAIAAPVDPQPLFFKTSWMMDLSLLEPCRDLSSSPPMSLGAVLSYWAHVRMDGDVLIRTTAADVAQSCFDALVSNRRPLCRHVVFYGDAEHVPQQVREVLDIDIVQSLDEQARFDVILAAASGEELSSYLHPGGLIIGNESSNQDSLDIIGQVTAPTSSGKEWTLSRAHVEAREPSGTLVLLSRSDSPLKTEFLVVFPQAVQIAIQEGSKWLEGLDDKYHGCDLIVLDDGEKSILADRAGSDLVPALPTFIERTNNTIWVSRGLETESPFHGLAGPWLGVVTSENFGLAAVNLAVSLASHPAAVASATDRLLRQHIKEAQVQLNAHDQILTCRYLPDDLQAVQGGANSGSLQISNGQGRQSQVQLIRPGVVAPVAATAEVTQQLEEDTVQVQILASAIDVRDMSIIAGQETADQNLGQLFLGRLEDEKLVFGYAPGAHSTTVFARRSDTIEAELVPSQDPCNAIVVFARLAAAVRLVQMAKYSAGDVVMLEQSSLEQAIRFVLSLHGEYQETKCSSQADVVFKGTTANGRQLPMDYGISRLTSASGRREWLRQVAELVSKFTPDGEITSADPAAAESWKPFESAISGIQAGPSHLVHGPSSGLFSSKGIHVLVGGLGGLGKVLAQWMFDMGARHVALMGRSGDKSPEAKKTIESLRGFGLAVTVCAVDAADRTALASGLEALRRISPIRSITNLAMVLRDAPASKMTGEQWDASLAPKLHASWNLHELTLQDDLQHFVMFSSIASIMRNRAQSNYNAGNGFQNALCAYRRSKGLPGVALDLGLMVGVGALAEDGDRVIRACRMKGLRPLGGKELFQIAEAVYAKTCPPLTITGLDSFEKVNFKLQAQDWQTEVYWSDFPEFSPIFKHRKGAEDADAQVSLRERIERAGSAEEGIKILLKAIIAHLALLLGYQVDSIDSKTGIASLGMDSLAAIEMRLWFARTLGQDVPVFDILGSRSIEELAQRSIQGLVKSDDAGSAQISIPEPVRITNQPSNRPLSHSQKRLWFLQKLLTDKTIYNLLLVCHIKGDVDVNKLQDAWSAFVARHEVLYSALQETAEEGLQQVPTSKPTFHMIKVDISEQVASEQAHSIDQITRASRSHVFNIEDGELVRGWLVKTAKDQWQFFLASHHLAWDRASVKTIFAEVPALYINGPQANIDRQPVQFIEYTLWQEKWLSDAKIVDPLLQYWRDALSNAPAAPPLLPFALRERPVVKEYHTSVTEARLPPALFSKVKEISKRLSVTPFMLLVSTFAALYSRSTGAEELVIGIMDGDRGHAMFNDMVGFTVNMLPLRITVGESFDTCIESTREACFSAYRHNQLPFDVLLQKLDVPRSTSHSPIFSLSVNYQVSGGYKAVDFGKDFTMTHFDHFQARSASDLNLELVESADGSLECLWEFDVALYDSASVAQLANKFSDCIELISSQGTALPVKDIKLLSDADMSIIERSWKSDRSFLPATSSTVFDPLPSQLIAAAQIHASRPALSGSEFSTLTFAQLFGRASRLAAHLQNSGVGPGQFVGVSSDPDDEMMTAILAVLLTGAAYVPIDPDYPAARFEAILTDARITRVLVSSARREAVSSKVLSLSADAKIVVIRDIVNASGSATLRPVNVKPDQPLYAIFTSGSTGRPKGVEVTHGNVASLLLWMRNYFALGGSDKVLFSTAFIFDISVPQILLGILTGACTVVASREERLTPKLLAEVCIKEHISFCYFTPTQYSMLLATVPALMSKWIGLRACLLAGEAIAPRLIRAFYEGSRGSPSRQVFNGYGPTECCINSHICALTVEDSFKPRVPIGRPAGFATGYVLDDQLELCPIGTPGQLYIGGALVSKGYLGRPDLTAAAFVPDLYAKASDASGNGIMYKTGDSVRILPDGRLDYLGRIGGDRQVKVKGFRIELEEIESAIWDASHLLSPEQASIVEAAVVVFKSEDEHHVKNGQIVAWISYSAGVGEEAFEVAELVDLLRMSLRGKLPHYMVPNSFQLLENQNLPHTASGKTDYKALSTTEPKQARAGTTQQIPQHSSSSSVTGKLSSLWMSKIGLDEPPTADQSFFDLGGHSLSLVSLQNDLQEVFKVDVPLSQMFSAITLQSMSELIESCGAQVDAKPNYSNGDVEGIANNGQARKVIHEVDWLREAQLGWEPSYRSSAFNVDEGHALRSVVVTGAASFIGAHLLHELFRCPDVEEITCIATGGASTEKEAIVAVQDALRAWHLSSTPRDTQRLRILPGALTHPTLGLSEEQIDSLRRRATSILHIATDVNLLQSYEKMRAANVDSVRFLLDLCKASGLSGEIQPKAFHYLSTWGVPQLQSWNDTVRRQSEDSTIYTTEVELSSRILPSSNTSLAYLKCRWVAEALISQAAAHGVPSAIFRTCSFSGSSETGIPVAVEDINSQIARTCIRVGGVPDFAKADGSMVGVASWIPIDIAMQGMLALTELASAYVGQAQIFHITPARNLSFAELGGLLSGSRYSGDEARDLPSMEPSEWLSAARRLDRSASHAVFVEAIEQLHREGWVPFALDSSRTRALLHEMGARGIPDLEQSWFERLVLAVQ